MRRKIEILGTKIGMLFVKEKCGDDLYKCVCECGREVTKKRTQLVNDKHHIKSCGCYSKLARQISGLDHIAENSAAMINEIRRLDSNINVINGPVRKDNKTGHTGICFDSAHNMYYAYLYEHHRRHNLGRFSKFEDAVCAREDAERTYFDPIREEHNKIFGSIVKE